MTKKAISVIRDYPMFSSPKSMWNGAAPSILVHADRSIRLREDRFCVDIIQLILVEVGGE